MIERFKYIDRLKGFAMLCVVLGHLVCFTMYDTWDEAIHDINLAFVSVFHVPLFIFLSGFVIKTPPNNKKLLRKSYCFLIPFLFFGGIYTFVINSNVESFFINDFKNGYWYLIVLTFFYYFISLQRFAKNKVFEFAIPFIIVICLFLTSRYLPLVVSKALSLGMCYTLYPFFVLGYFARKYSLIEWLLKNNWLFSIALFLLIPIYILFSNGTFNHFIQGRTLVILIILLFIFRQQETSNSYIEKILAFIGRNSLDVYVFQYFFFLIINLRDIAPWFNKTGNVLFESLLLILVALLVSVLCIFLGKLFKKSLFIMKFVYGSF